MNTATPPRRDRAAWLAVCWPAGALLLLACLGAAQLLPAGAGRALAALPIELTVPGALTVAAFSGRRRTDALLFGCLAVLLSIVWLVFASLLLYIVHVPISQWSTYLCLLGISAVLAVTAQVHLLTGAAPSGALDAEPGLLADEGGSPAARHPRASVLTAFAAGALLLYGGGYAYVHSSTPAPADYTSIAWTGQPITGVINVGAAGTVLPFRVAHHGGPRQNFTLGATWSGTGGAHSLAQPLELKLGPDREMSGSLSIPAPPGGCTYRVTVTLRQLDVATPRSWTINADVRRSGGLRAACAS